MKLLNYLKPKKIVKAGTIPYMRDNGIYKFLFMVPSNPYYGGNKPQIAKGIVDKGETVQQAAIREGKEELGITTYETSYYLGKYKFKRPLYMYAIKLSNTELTQPHYETGEVVWVKYEDIFDTVRPEQLNIITDCINKIFIESMKHVMIR